MSSNTTTAQKTVQAISLADVITDTFANCDAQFGLGDTVVDRVSAARSTALVDATIRIGMYSMLRAAPGSIDPNRPITNPKLLGSLTDYAICVAPRYPDRPHVIDVETTVSYGRSLSSHLGPNAVDPTILPIVAEHCQMAIDMSAIANPTERDASHLGETS